MSALLGWVVVVAWAIVTAISLGYYNAAGKSVPWRPWWFRVGSGIIEVAAVWLAIRVIM